MNMLVPIIMGSQADKDWALKIAGELDKWGIKSSMHVLSAHKVPELLLQAIIQYNSSEEKICYVTIAGRSNGLSGVTAASSVHPVIACPPFKDKDDMMVNINSTLQMPSDTPVMTILEPSNVALAIAKIFGLVDEDMKNRCRDHINKVKSSFKI
jgi:phosphoribosylaminoimidazole carboxylase PurE protein